MSLTSQAIWEAQNAKDIDNTLFRSHELLKAIIYERALQLLPFGGTFCLKMLALYKKPF